MSIVKPDNEVDGKDSRSIKHSSWIHNSYSIGGFLDNFLTGAFTVRVIGFYEDEVLLPIILVGIAYVIYGFWNMINDPLAGFISDRPTRFTRRWGRRFPWFIVSAIPCAIIYFLIFTVPPGNVIILFFWLLIMLCLFDLFFSFWTINWNAIYPDKFRSNKERTRVAGLYTIWGMVGLALGMLLPPMFITYGDQSSYVNAALLVMVISVLCVLLMIPAMREDKEIIDRVLRVSVEDQEEQLFLKTLKTGVKQKNFMAFLIVYLAQMVLTVLMLSSFYYWVRYILNMEAETEIFLSAAFLIGGMLSVPLWVKMGRKFGNKKAITIGAGLTTLLFIPFLFVSTLALTILSAILLGIGVGAIWTLRVPAFSDVIDEIVTKTKVRNEGIYYGIMTFFGRLSIIIGAVTIAIVHELTNYSPGAEMQTPMALWGIRVIIALVPMIFYFIGFLVIWKIYDLNVDKVNKVQKELKELNL
ncbi:MAG: MFS transporter [Candidatus Lokiarchaeota archaeon]|nr:MFS transporter [Candidatus Lokiarchaeota archaeon]MBD3342468.1 MFS transporter [Candidatus Lokiarchaeota archaeon]